MKKTGIRKLFLPLSTGNKCFNNESPNEFWLRHSAIAAVWFCTIITLAGGFVRNLSADRQV